MNGLHTPEQLTETLTSQPSILDESHLATPAPAAVQNIPPDGRIYNLGRIPGQLHVYNTGRPGGGNTNYHLTIVHVGYFPRQLPPGHTHSYNAAGNAVYIQNNGPSTLQVLYSAANAEAPRNSLMESLARSAALASADPADDVMSKLQSQWYNTLVSGLGLDSSSFQLIQASQSLSFTSKALWEYFNTVPPASLTHVFSSSKLNNLFDNYKSVVMTILPPDGSQFREVMGDDYPAWITHQKSLPAGADVLSAFLQWASVNLDPGRGNKAYTIYAQLLNGTVGVAVKNALNPAFIDPNNGPKFSRSIQDLRDALVRAPSRNVSFDSATASSNTSHTWAQGNIGGSYRFFSASAGGRFDQLSKKVAGSHLKVAANFKQVLSFATAPGGWFSSAALNIAYGTRDNTVWPAGQKPDWDSTFGPSGNLQRMATELVVADGLDITIESDASLSEGEQRAISAEAKLSVWPFFSASASGGHKTDVQFDASGKMVVKTVVPLGNPTVLGVNVLPIERVLSR